MLSLMGFALVYALALSVRALRRNPLRATPRGKLAWGMALLYIIALAGCCLAIVFVDLPGLRKQGALIQAKRSEQEAMREKIRAEARREAESRVIKIPQPPSIKEKFTIQLPSGWAEAARHGDNTIYEAMHNDGKHRLFVRYNEGGFGEAERERIADNMMANIKSSMPGAVAGEKEAVEIGGRQWFRIRVETDGDDGREKHCIYLYSGNEGTFYINTVAPFDIRNENARQLEDMVKTFRFSTGERDKRP